ncbi:MAG: aspartate/glutamate racemase family protein [Desulfovermiculus sp.]|nr:aspartate/glutamate racemase family protein [Desulfovermiculus sp.]
MTERCDTAMIFKARKGQTSYGELIGILMLDTNTPFIQGDVGNAASYGYPVRFKRIDGLTPDRIFDHDQSFVQAMIDGARELEREGVRAITGDCGFMAIYQHKAQEAVDIPVFLSSLLQIPFITSIIKSSSRVGVLTANSKSLTQEMLVSLGLNNMDRLVIAGLEDTKDFKKAAIEDVGLLDSQAVRQEVVQAAQTMHRKNSNLGAMLLECSMLPPYAADVQEVTGLPVFDYLSMIDHLAASLLKKRFPEKM